MLDFCVGAGYPLVSGNCIKLYRHCIEVLRKKCALLEYYKNYEIAYIKCVMRPSTASADMRHTHFKKLK